MGSLLVCLRVTMKSGSKSLFGDHPPQYSIHSFIIHPSGLKKSQVLTDVESKDRQSFSCEKVGAWHGIGHNRRHVVRFSDFRCQRIF